MKYKINLFENYIKLIRDFPNNCEHLFGQPLRPNGTLWLSIDCNAYPSLLFKSKRDDHRNDIELSSLSAQFSRYCNIEDTKGLESSDIYTIIRINESDLEYIQILFRLMEDVFFNSDIYFTNREISTKILDLSNLFKQICDSDGDVIGLWGELYILSQTKNLDTAVKCWCNNKMAKYDFITQDFALEVKTTTRTLRKHNFSLEQLRPKETFCIYVASLLLVQNKAGKTAGDLIDILHSDIANHELRSVFLKQCLIKGGKNIYRNPLKFNTLPEGKSLALFNASDIPTPIVAADSLIENVKFDIDITNLKSLSNFEISSIMTFSQVDT